MKHVTVEMMQTAAASETASGVQRGTDVMTLNGLRPVESLQDGDRIVTRTGAVVLRSVVRTAAHGFKLLFDAPQVILLANGHVHSDTGLAFEP